MDDKKLSIRPVLNLSSQIVNEDFQNATLRPILKLQHAIILALFINFCKKQKIKLLEIKEGIYLSEVTNIIKKNSVLRNQYIGIVIGQFTIEEYTKYLKNDTEFNKRILNMIVQRITDSQSEIKKIINKQQQ